MIIHADDPLDFKEKRRKKRERKLKTKQKRRNPIALELQQVHFHERRIEMNKERGGAKNLLKDIEKEDLDE